MLKDNLYIGIFINMFQQQTVKTLKLFKDAKEMMEDPAGEHRRVLTKLTLVFSHALTELKAVFADGVYKEDYTIVKHDVCCHRVSQHNHGYTVTACWWRYRCYALAGHVTRTHGVKPARLRCTL